MSKFLTYEKDIEKEVGFIEKNINEEDIKEILCADIKTTDNYKVYKYKINGSTYKTVVSKEYDNLRMTEIDIKPKTDEFVNGYKVVRTVTGAYSYKRELDNLVLECRFDIATNFNEHGLALVARNGKVTWMNQNYELLNIRGEFVPYKGIIDNPNEFGFQGVGAFSKGDIPLSRVVDRNTKILSKNNSTVSFGFAYVEPNGKYKAFCEYDGESLSNHKTVNFEKGYGVDFDENGCAFGTNYIIFANGGYVSTSNLRDIAKKEFFVNAINKHVTKACNEQGKQYVKIDHKPRSINSTNNLPTKTEE